MLLSSMKEEPMLGRRAEAVLENLAVAARGTPERAGRDARGATEAAHEVGEVGETDVERDVGDGPVIVGQQPRGMAQAAAHEVLVRRDAEHGGEEAQVVPGAEAGTLGLRGQVDGGSGMRIEPERRLDGTPSIALAWRIHHAARRAAHARGARREREADLVEADVVAA